MEDRTKVHYRFDVDHDVLASCSRAAFEAEYCSPVLVTQESVLIVYDLYVNRYIENPDLNPGKKIGQFELQQCNGWSEVKFFYQRVQHTPEWTETEKMKGKRLSQEKRVKFVADRLDRIGRERKALQDEVDERLHKVMDTYFRYLEERDIRPRDALKTIKGTRAIEGEYDWLCLEYVNREAIPFRTREQFIDEYFPNGGVSTKYLGRLLEDAYKRKVIGKTETNRFCPLENPSLKVSKSP